MECRVYESENLSLSMFQVIVLLLKCWRTVPSSTECAHTSTIEMTLYHICSLHQSFIRFSETLQSLGITHISTCIVAI